MTIRLPAGARKIKEILEDTTKTPEQKLIEIEKIVDDKLKFKIRSFSAVRDKFRPESIKISQQFYKRMKAIINRVHEKNKKA